MYPEQMDRKEIQTRIPNVSGFGQAMTSRYLAVSNIIFIEL